MTRIDEMDEFFNFEDATNSGMAIDGGHGGISPRHPSSSLYDIDLILAQAADDDDSFNSLQHFEIDPPPDLSQYSSGNVGDIRMGEADVNDYPNWINGAEKPPKPCLYCGNHNLDCIFMPTAGPDQKRICTSCVALSRHCSFSFEKPVNSAEFRESFRPYVGENVNHADGTPSYMEKDAFGLRCAILNRNARAGSLLPQLGMRDEGSESPGRTGARFSRETVRLLRNWLSVHHVHPYPTEEEKEDLKRKTGLTKTQITNWLANARRRGQVKAPRGKSPSLQTLSTRPINIPKRSSTALQNMDPMERWESSPPEHEPASVIDIAKAVKTSPNIASNRTSPDSYPRSDDGSARSIARESSASSRGTSQSSHASFASGLSLQSRGSFGSFGQRGRRRRRPAAKVITTLANGAPRQYQCTFCIETFKTKHDWQRHEKSLHLSLERWVCAPNVSKIIGTPHKCAFCGLQNPDGAHYETHNYNICQERSIEERTFYRKDHLRQHLRLVHECQFLSNSMESWRITAPQVRSRCGFCGLTLETWSARVDHLAEHFKGGKTMTDWKGPWGFDVDVQKLVENGTPPYLIHSKKVTAMSNEAAAQIERPDLTPYDLVKGQLLEFANKQAVLGRNLSDKDLRAAASRIMADYRKTNDSTGTVSSWFCDLIMCPDDSVWLEDLRRKATLGTRQQKQDRGSSPKPLDINNKESVEKYCEFERQLVEFVNAQRSLGLAPTDAELKAAGCKILMEYDGMYSTVQSATAATWFCEQIMASHGWTEGFRRRVGLPPSAEIEDGQGLSKQVDQTIHNYGTLEAKLADFVKVQVGLGVIPSDTDLQRQARLIIYEIDDPFLQTAADDAFWLIHFKINHGLSNVDGPVHSLTPESSGNLSQSRSPVSPSSDSNNSMHNSPLPQQPGKARSLYTLQDANCYRRLELELSRFVASCVSKHSPNPHIPTDEEIRRQARWILYNDDDPWNQTALDNEEWLLRFKRSNGLAPPEDGPGMPRTLEETDMHFGGTGLTPPTLGSEDLVDVIPMVQDDLTSDWHKPASSCSLSNNAPKSVPRLAMHTTFSSWKLESSLADFARQSLAKGYIPTDEQLRTQARAIVGVPVTSADDPLLLQKFKELYGIASQPSYSNSPVQNSAMDFGAPPRTSSPTFLISNANMEAEKLNAHWMPAQGRSRSSGAQVQDTLGIQRLQNVNSSAARSTSMNRDSYQNNIDPQLWGNKELATHLAGIMGQDTHVTM